jgi:hypothetical protein
MIGKMVLPIFGGTPAVWITCMFFFQTGLLAGYAYAHFSIKWLGLRLHVLVHVTLLALSLLVLPIIVDLNLSSSTSSNPTLWLLSRLVVSVGPPFFMVSTTAPLLQRWFAASDHLYAGDPYFLYALSNIGSFAALLSYPLIFEHLMNIFKQSWIWSVGYGLYILMVFFCGTILLYSRLDTNDSMRNTKIVNAIHRYRSPSIRDRFLWIFASFVPSSLMLGVTSHLTADIAAIPMLWVVPLALYLLTFVLVFSKKQILPHAVVGKIMPFIIIPLSLFFLLNVSTIMWLTIPAHLLMFFVAAMMCHGELAKRRPATPYLTEFYLWMSFGGLLGGFFNAIIAPRIFNYIIEYPLAIVMACFFLPVVQLKRGNRKQRFLDFVFPLLLAGFSYLLVKVTLSFDLPDRKEFMMFLFMWSTISFICFSFKKRPIRFALAFGVILFFGTYFFSAQLGEVQYRSRNFFGVKKIVIDRKANIRTLIHGTTLHGAQSLDSYHRREPLTYFHRKGPIGDVFTVFNSVYKDAEVAIIGLGAGSLASYLKPGQRVTFYEIDPDVAKIALNTRFFNFLSDSLGEYKIVIGDGRLAISHAPEHQYNLIIMDAFSSDAVPVHLLTREALELYLSKLDPNGIVVFHISNRYLNLEPILGRLSRMLDLICLARFDKSNAERSGSHYVVIGRSGSIVDKMTDFSNWRIVPGYSNFPVWSDNYSSIIRLFK